MLEFKEAYNTITVGTREQLNVFPFAVSELPATIRPLYLPPMLMRRTALR